MKKILCFLIFVLIFLPTAYALYPEVGNQDSYFQQGTGFFNTELTTITSATRTISSQDKAPLVADLNNDSILEIIIIEDDTIRLFQNRTLGIIDSYTFPANEKTSNLIVFDIDGDDYNEIIVAQEESETLYILEYNGTDFFNQTGIDFSGITQHTSGANAGEMIIKCAKANNCLMAYSDQITHAPGTNHYVHATAFNSTDRDAVGGIQLRVSGSANINYCMPKIRTMSAADYDNDGDTEYIFSFIQNQNGGAETVIIHYVGVDDSLTVTNEQSRTFTTADLTSAASCSTGDVGKFITPPLVFNADGASSNGLETIFGYNHILNEFIMISMRSNTATISRHPDLFNADGQMISNVMKANVFTDTSDVDFCVLGYDETDLEIDLLCSSLLTEQEGDREFLLDVENLYNITGTYDNYNSLAHTAQHSTATTDGVNIDEIVSSYGILALDWGNTCRSQFPFPNILCLSLIYENPQVGSSSEGATVISVDAEQVGRDDLILTTDTNIWYLDDVFVNSPGVISNYVINPCIDSTWKANTTLEVRITPIDVDNDFVSARAFLYYGDPNEQASGWSANVSSGTTISISNFNVNKTIAVGTLRLQARDTHNPTILDTIDLTFSVSNNGVSFGECLTDSGDLTAPETAVDAAADDVLDPDANAVNDLIQPLATQFQLTRTILWLIVMFGTALILGIIGLAGGATIGDASIELNLVQASVLIIIIEFFLLLLGTLFGYLSSGILISIVVIGLIIVGMWLRKVFTGSSSSNG